MRTTTIHLRRRPGTGIIIDTSDGPIQVDVLNVEAKTRYAYLAVTTPPDAKLNRDPRDRPPAA
jgi:hypothetical protein